MTNGDKIRKMTDEDLAEFISFRSLCPDDAPNCYETVIPCLECWLDWLRKEADE